MKQILPGNAISLVAAAFIAASCCVHGTRKASLLQIGANLVLGAWSGLVTLLLSSLRMLLILYNTYNRRQMAVFCVLTVAVGLWSIRAGFGAFAHRGHRAAPRAKLPRARPVFRQAKHHARPPIGGRFIARSS